MKNYCCYYKHTFGVDVVRANNLKEATEKALMCLKEEFKMDTIYFSEPILVNDCNKTFYAKSLFDLIDSIEEESEEDEDFF